MTSQVGYTLRTKRNAKILSSSHIVGGNGGIVIVHLSWVYYRIKQININASVFVNQDFWCRIKRYRFMIDEVK